MNDAPPKQNTTADGTHGWQSIGSLAEALVRSAEAKRAKELEGQD
ncbi:MAG: hypothetical protein AAFO57_06110 [Pseudomonadota bacterium]